MFGSVKQWFGVFAIALVMESVGARDVIVDGASGPANPGIEESGRGQYGGDLQLLRSFATWPGEGESNFYFDLWEPGSLSAFARIHGLTNNHALLIDSHGADRRSWKGRQFVFRPGRAMGLVPPPPMYSIRDVARVLGRSASEVHNIVIAGCNEAGALDSAAFRSYFVNATNVIYMAAGQRSYKPQFYQMLTQHSEDLEPLYERVISGEGGHVHSEILRAPAEGAKRLGWFIADSFRPAETKPFRRQRAGRELLEPGTPRATGLRAESNLDPTLR